MTTEVRGVPNRFVHAYVAKDAMLVYVVVIPARL